MRQMRTAIFELRPLILETEGLEAALKTFLERRQDDSEVQAQLVFRVDSPHPTGKLSRFDSKVETSVFAIIQEAVNNAIKHAQAKNITVHLREAERGIHVTIADNGKGFDIDNVMSNYAQRTSLGMQNIKERTELLGGDLHLTSNVGAGTQIRVFIPRTEADRKRKRGVTGRLQLPE